MSGNTVTQSDTQSATWSLARAARELELRRGEFDLAVHLGYVRTVLDEGGGGRRVTRAETDRVRSQEGFPEALRERVKAVGTTEGAALLGISTARFTRLARLGLVVPVKFYLNRYRAVVWLYLAEELYRFPADKQNAPLLRGRTPEGLRDQLEAGLDLRPRNWRGRHMGFLLRQTEGPWARAAVVASLLDPVQVAEVITDPYERACLNRFRPERPSHGAPDSPAAHLVSRIMTAEDPDEISWLRADLGQAVAEARETHPAPRPTQRAEPGVVPEPAGSSPAHSFPAHSSRARSSPVASRPVVPAPAAFAPAAPVSAAAAPVVSTAVASRPETATSEDLPAAGERGWPRGLVGWLRRRST
ncbi:DUF6397 family protein [Streptomyces sp. RPA4-2]|uniref:DUF6397 family protein n=1 Tax=Streptomyces sp. RPA4-2 TaxID=2721244 RepID=UPI002001DA90|nr:DUF6397 family protein [Streptomyces sp. RPA4-2]